MTSALMRAMSFDELDLLANRQGDLSRRQSERMKRRRRRQTALAAVFFLALVVLATILMYIGQDSGNIILEMAGGILIALNAVMVGIMGRAYMRLGGDLRAGSVEALSGKVERVLRRGRQGDSYLIRIDGCKLPVTREVFTSFRHEARYRIYRTANARLLLSAERTD